MATIDYPPGRTPAVTNRGDDRISGMTDRTGSFTWTYNARGELTSLAAPNGTVSYTYYPTGQRYTMGRSNLSWQALAAGECGTSRAWTAGLRTTLRFNEVHNTLWCVGPTSNVYSKRYPSV